MDRGDNSKFLQPPFHGISSISNRYDLVLGMHNHNARRDAEWCISRPTLKKFVEFNYQLVMSATTTSQLNSAITVGTEKGNFVLPKGPSGKVKLAPERTIGTSKENAKPASKRPPSAKATTATLPRKKATATKQYTSRAKKGRSTSTSAAGRKVAKKLPTKRAAAKKVAIHFLQQSQSSEMGTSKSVAAPRVASPRLQQVGQYRKLDTIALRHDRKRELFRQGWEENKDDLKGGVDPKGLLKPGGRSRIASGDCLTAGKGCANRNLTYTGRELFESSIRVPKSKRHSGETGMICHMASYGDEAVGAERVAEHRQLVQSTRNQWVMVGGMTMNTGKKELYRSVHLFLRYGQNHLKAPQAQKFEYLCNHEDDSATREGVFERSRSVEWEIPICKSRRRMRNAANAKGCRRVEDEDSAPTTNGSAGRQETSQGHGRRCGEHAEQGIKRNGLYLLNGGGSSNIKATVRKVSSIRIRFHICERFGKMAPERGMGRGGCQWPTAQCDATKPREMTEGSMENMKNKELGEYAHPILSYLQDRLPNASVHQTNNISGTAEAAATREG
ncbi:hypothetical protein EDC04DRAFT_2612785 [Pisolithus marmoratus]|nr:hypothetical protein EDC04DRAFT_2612785 [Pisolithus marmoratus]